MGNTTNGTRPLSKRLEEPEVVAAINRLLDRLDALENTVETLNRVVKEGPGFTAMATDIIDETVRQASSSGVDVEHRIQNALTITEKLTDDQTTRALDKALTLAQEAPGFVAMIADMFDEQMQQANRAGIDVEARLKGALELGLQLTDPKSVTAFKSAIELAAEAPGFVAMMGDMFDEQVRLAADSGIDIETRLKGVLTLARKLTEPQMMHALENGLDLAAEAPGFVAMVADMFDEHMQQAAQSGVDLETRVKGLLHLANKITEPETTHAMEGLLNHEAVMTVSALGKALSESRKDPIEPLGPMGTLKTMRDPDVKYAIGFLLKVARSLGSELKK